MSIKEVLDTIGIVLLGKPQQIKLSMACVLANGHLLIEDIPGMGKTTLAHTMAHVLNLNYSRVQFTSDLLPADLLGANIFNRDSQSFEFHPGPVFANIVLADEINRATPKAQSALLEAMEERQVSIEGTTHTLPEPFFVIATQNPLEQAGTFPLPESQLDRFLMRIKLGYPPRTIEKALYQAEDSRVKLQQIRYRVPPEQLRQWQAQANSVNASDVLVEYVLEIVSLSRQLGAGVNGLSPRGGLSMLKAAKAWAFMEGRDYVIPEDVQAIMESVVVHRIKSPEVSERQLSQWIADLKAIPVPR